MWNWHIIFHKLFLLIAVIKASQVFLLPSIQSWVSSIVQRSIYADLFNLCLSLFIEFRPYLTSFYWVWSWIVFQVSFCHKTKVPILGVVENMAKFVCPHCNHTSILFPSTTGRRRFYFARSMHHVIFIDIVSEGALAQHAVLTFIQGEQQLCVMKEVWTCWLNYHWNPVLHKWVACFVIVYNFLVDEELGFSFTT